MYIIYVVYRKKQLILCKYIMLFRSVEIKRRPITRKNINQTMLRNVLCSEKGERRSESGFAVK